VVKGRDGKRHEAVKLDVECTVLEDSLGGWRDRKTTRGGIKKSEPPHELVNSTKTQKAPNEGFKRKWHERALNRGTGREGGRTQNKGEKRTKDHLYGTAKKRRKAHLSGITCSGVVGDRKPNGSNVIKRHEPSKAPYHHSRGGHGRKHVPKNISQKRSRSTSTERKRSRNGGPSAHGLEREKKQSLRAKM